MLMFSMGLFSIHPATAAMLFDGVDDYLSAKGKIPAGLESMTICVWIKGLHHNANLFRSEAFLLHFDCPYAFYLMASDGSNSGYLKWDTDVTCNQEWQHLAATWSNPVIGDGKMRLYINGKKQKKDLSFTGGKDKQLASLRSLLIGRKFNEGIQFHQGLLEDARFYARALSNSEILAIYAMSGSDQITNGLLWQFKLNESPPGTRADENQPALDSSANANHAIAHGDPIYRLSALNSENPPPSHAGSAAEIEDNEARKAKFANIAGNLKKIHAVNSLCKAKKEELTNWFKAHPHEEAKWSDRFGKLNKLYDMQAGNVYYRTEDILRQYLDLEAEAGLELLFENQ